MIFSISEMFSSSIVASLCGSILKFHLSLRLPTFLVSRWQASRAKSGLGEPFQYFRYLLGCCNRLFSFSLLVFIVRMGKKFNLKRKLSPRLTFGNCLFNLRDEDTLSRFPFSSQFIIYCYNYRLLIRNHDWNVEFVNKSCAGRCYCCHSCKFKILVVQTIQLLVTIIHHLLRQF